MPPQVREDIVPLKTYLAACDGQRAALTEFFSKAIPFLRGTVQQVLQRRKPAAMGLCEDFVQDICAALLAPDTRERPPIERAAMKRYDAERAQIRSFLFVFARSRTIDRLKFEDARRPSTPLIPISDLADWAAVAPQATEQPDWRLALDRLQRHLQSVLSAREQQVLDLILACCPAEKIAARLEISVANVHSITYRLRQTISATWLAAMGEPFPWQCEKKTTKTTEPKPVEPPRDPTHLAEPLSGAAPQNKLISCQGGQEL